MEKIIIIAGFSASGKDTLARELCNHGYKITVSTTTRPMRESEEDGVDYNFIKEENFLDKIQKGEFLEYRVYDTIYKGKAEKWYYGTDLYSIKEEKTVMVLDLEGAERVSEIFGKDRVDIFFLKCDLDIRKQRIKNRGDYDEKEFIRRSNDDYYKFKFYKTDYKIINSTNVEENAREVIEYVNKHN